MYQILNYTADLSEDTVRSAIDYACQQWRSIVPFNFSSKDTPDADITISFQTRSHMFNNVTQCTAFDGPDKVVAHAFSLKTGIIHFEDAETWTDDLRSPSWEKDRFACVLHEGYVVGLDHSTVPESVMWPTHINGRRSFACIQAIQQLFSIGK